MQFINTLKTKFIRFLKDYSDNYVPRWVILFIDVTIAFISLNAAFFFISTLSEEDYHIISKWGDLFIVLVLQILFFILFKSFLGLIRYSSYKDAVKQLQVIISTVISVLIINYFAFEYFKNKLIVDAGILIYGFISFSMLFFFRVLVKRLYELIYIDSREAKMAYILGTSSSDVAMAEGLVSQSSTTFQIMGFINTKDSRTRNRIFNLPIYDLEQIKKSSNYAKSVILSDERLNELRKSSANILTELLDLQIRIYKIPKIEDWDQKNSVNLKEINIEDLLQRNPIKLNNKKLSAIYENKTVLVTGAAGSIGSEIVRQLIPFKPEKVLLLDQAETPLHDLSLELKREHPNLKFEKIIANVRDKTRVKKVFETYLPDIVFHGAAYKHVPMMEANPLESISVNFKGTKNLTDLSIEYKVERFVFVSTDKAVNPTNIMGASKRSAEIYVQYLSNLKDTETLFITTRFGNVLGSNGSVVPLFKKQIESRGPVTVTHPEITRYFMTIDEACQLVLEAGAMGKGGEIYVFDMGQPVKIVDLARNLIKLTGLVPDIDIKIQFTGLRPGEKLYEELLADKETTLPTHHEKIMIAKASHQFDKSKLSLLTSLNENIKANQEKEALLKLKELVPEYEDTLLTNKKNIETANLNK